MALPNPLEAFVWGPGGAQMTPEQVARQREIADALLNQAGDTSPVAHWSQGAARVANALAGKFKEARANKAEASNAEGSQSRIAALLGGMTGGGAAEFPAAPGGAGQPFTTDAGGATVGGGPAPDMSGNQIYSEFMDTVKAGGVTNPNALAAIAATGKRESGFSPGNVNRTWSDPSERGQAGTAGGIMSWRGPRYQALAATGDLSPAGQARYFLQEDPQLIAALNNAKSPEEAIGLMNNAWKFAGYNRPGGEAGARLQAARSYLPTFQGQSSPAVAANEAMATGQPIQTASLDPSIGMGQVGPVPAEYAATGLSPEQWQAMNAPDGAVRAAPSVPMPAPVEGAGFQVGGPATSTDAGNRVVQALINPQSMTGGAPMPLQGGAPANAPQNSGAPQGAGSQGEIRRGSDGQTYQYAETTGMDGFSGPNGWIRVNTAAGGFPSVQTAQASPQDLSNLSPMAGGTAGTSPADASGGGFNQGMQAAIAQALSSPYASDGEKKIAGLLLNQQMAQNDPGNQLDMEYKRAQIAALNAKGTGPAELGLNPQYGVDANGNPVLIQIGKDGKAVQTAMPEGIQLSKEPIKMDAGTHWVLLDPITRQPVGQIPKENRQAAFDTAVGGAEGKAVGEANVQLPQTIATAEQSLANIDAVINDPNLDYAVGAAGILPAIPGTAQAGTVARIEQLQGTAFLQAFEALKGGGQITEIEGKKATDAIARLSRAQKKDDFVDALSDLRAIVASGLDRARRKGGGAASDSEPAPTQRRLKFNPATGELE